MNKIRNRKWIYMLPMLALLLTAIPTAALGAGIQGGAPTLTVNSTTRTVMFGGQEWYVIGTKNAGGTTRGVSYASMPNDSATLLLKTGQASSGSPPYGISEFRKNSNSNYTTDKNEYKGSDLHKRMENAADSLSSAERNVVNKRTLTSGDDSAGHLMKGGNVADQLFWPISYDEFDTIKNNSIRAYGGEGWWLRTAVADIRDRAFYASSDGIFQFQLPVTVDYFALRPAFNLDLSSVLFSSAAVGGKSVAAVEGGLVGVSAPAGTIKFTFLDNDIATPALTLLGTTNGTGSIGYSYTGAQTGTNQYLSCVLKNDGGVQYYGKLASCANSGSGTVTIDLTGVAAGDYTLDIFSEQANENNESDFAGAPATMTLSVDGSGNGTVPETATDNDKPTVAGVSPNTSGVPVSTAALSVTFDQAMNTAITDGAPVGSVSLSGGDTAPTLTFVGWSNDGMTANYTLSGLAYSTTYTYHISGFADTEGNVMDAVDSGYTFTTADDTASYIVTLYQSDGGTATVSHTAATAGTPVALGISSLETGYSFVRWDVSPSVAWTSGSAGSRSAEFAMPDSNVAVAPVYQYSSGGPVRNDATVNPTAAAFDRNTSGTGYADVSTTLTPNGNTFGGVTLDGNPVEVSGYTVSGNQYTFEKEYLATLGTGNRAFVFNMSGGTNPAFT
ncbi:MAG: hypothetical protein LBV27_09765, partial [Oscillospiraceae bacterium]|nr:hypothetical protein [Oscillospiraceae bacterium]